MNENEEVGCLEDALSNEGPRHRIFAEYIPMCFDSRECKYQEIVPAVGVTGRDISYKICLYTFKDMKVKK
jgi:hypothetical protein